MSRWEAPAWVKIHQKCGGRIRWVEAIDTPGVGYTGECLECGAERVVVEEIIPVEVRGEIVGLNGGFGKSRFEFDIRDELLELDIETLRDLDWDESATFDENQRRLRAVVEDAEPRGGAE